MAYARIYPLIEALREKAEDIDGGDLTSKFQEIEEKWRKEFFDQGGTTAGFNIAKKVVNEMDFYRGGECCGRCMKLVKHRDRRRCHVCHEPIEGTGWRIYENYKDKFFCVKHYKELEPEHRIKCQPAEMKEMDEDEDSYDRMSKLAYNCVCPCIKCKSNKQFRNRWDGIVVKDLPPRLNAVRILEEKLPMDWHPGWENIIRDLVHPNMYCSLDDSGMRYIEAVVKAEKERPWMVMYNEDDGPIGPYMLQQLKRRLADRNLSTEGSETEVIGRYRKYVQDRKLREDSLRWIPANFCINRIKSQHKKQGRSENVNKAPSSKRQKKESGLERQEESEQLQKQVEKIKNDEESGREERKEPVGSDTLEVQITTPINNLCRLTFPDTYTAIEGAFKHFVPMFERSLGITLPEEVQVIVKLSNAYVDENSIANKDDVSKEAYGHGTWRAGEYEARKGRIKPGGWHVEGTPNEEILATGLYYYDVQGIEDSFLEFKIPVKDCNNMSYGQSDPQAWVDMMLSPGSSLQKYLGNVEVQDSRCVVFPNVLQHRPSGFSLKQAEKKGHRKLLAFFLVDPEIPTKSSADGLPKQIPIATKMILEATRGIIFEKKVVDLIGEYCDCWTWEEACRARLEIMHFRESSNRTASRFFENECSLCEH